MEYEEKLGEFVMPTPAENRRAAQEARAASQAAGKKAAETAKAVGKAADKLNQRIAGRRNRDKN